MPSPRQAAVDDRFGRGLLIVGEAADRWGVDELTVGKAVWCEMDVVLPGIAEGQPGRRLKQRF
ncbi:hypothetical protein ACWD4G_25335 [Streptomyces sp. NPDC002643]